MNHSLTKNNGKKAEFHPTLFFSSLLEMMATGNTGYRCLWRPPIKGTKTLLADVHDISPI